MKNFVVTDDKKFFFTSCDGCDARCCKGSYGTVLSQIVLEDFIEVSKHFPIVFSFGDMGFLKPNIVMSDGTSCCPYITNNRCSIYHERPSICKMYPLSPNLDDKIYIDTLCPAISTQTGKKIVTNGSVAREFDLWSLNGYAQKVVQTHLHFAPLNEKKDFKKIAVLGGIEIFIYDKSSSDRYVKMHKDSLAHLHRFGLTK